MTANILPQYPPNEDYLADLWQNAIFVFDANVLLKLYSLSPNVTEELCSVAERLADKNRLWFPHQVYVEYQLHVEEICRENSNQKFQSLYSIKPINKKIIELESIVQNAEFDDVRNEFEKAKILFGNIQSRIEQSKEAYYQELKGTISVRLEKLFNDRTGEGYSSKRILEVCLDGEQRYKFKIPPGYKDGTKGGKDQFGDLFIWFQMIDYAKLLQSSLIFITDDQKEDWWHSDKEQDVSLPRYSLLEEMSNEAQQKFYMYKITDFLEEAKTRLDLTVTENTFEELERIEDEQRTQARTLLEVQQEQELRLARTANDLGMSVNELKGFMSVMTNFRDHFPFQTNNPELIRDTKQFKNMVAAMKSLGAGSRDIPDWARNPRPDWTRNSPPKGLPRKPKADSETD